MTKKDARSYIKELKKAMSEQEIKSRSQKVMDNLLGLEAWHNADRILTYVSYNQEVDTLGLIDEALKLGKEVYVPKVYGKNMKFHRIDNLGLLKSGKYGILEPDNEFRSEWDNLSGLMIMPGLAFGRDFSRVGYGGGFYDRYLSDNHELTTIAVCFDFQLLDSIEVEEFDYRPDMIVCESEIISRLV